MLIAHIDAANSDVLLLIHLHVERKYKFDITNVFMLAVEMGRLFSRALHSLMERTCVDCIIELKTDEELLSIYQR